jgi:hypothetical protein
MSQCNTINLLVGQWSRESTANEQAKAVLIDVANEE